MNRPLIARAGIALALALGATAAAAAHGDRWYGTHRGDVYVQTTPIEVTRVERAMPGEVVVYSDRYVAPSTVVVERDYAYVTPRERIVVQADPYYGSTAMYDPRHPDWGHLIDYGLFNRDYPNHFGR